MDPSRRPVPEDPPPATAGPAAGAGLIVANVAPLEAAGLVLAIALLAVVGAATSLVEAITFGQQAAGVDGRSLESSRVAWLRERRRPVLIALVLYGTLSLVGASLAAVPLVATAAGLAGLPAAAVVPVLAVGGALLWAAFVVVRPRRHAAAGLVHPACSRALAIMHPLVRLALPAASLVAQVVDRIRERRRPEAETILAQDIQALPVGEEAGELLAEEEAALIHSILEFSETTVREVMVRREDMVALHVSATLDDALALIRDAGHSRYPLFGSTLDEILGVVYAKDLLPLAGDDAATTDFIDWTRLARPARFASPERNLDDQLADFRSQRTHIAIVADESGATLGLVTLEDLLEEVVGEIRDELDEPDSEPRLLPVGPGTYRADARLGLDAFFGQLGIQVDTDLFAFETVGGLVFHLAGAVLEEGDEVTFDRLRLRVETLEANRIREVSVRVSPAPS